jgi:hypothetical protein
MADFAIEISKTAVEVLVSKVKDAIKEELEQWQIVQRDFVFIKDEFETMQSFLSNGIIVKCVRNNMVKIWVRQVRDLSYDVEDCIEFILHLDTKKRDWWRRLLPSCTAVGTLLPLDAAVAEVKLLKSRVEDVSQRNLRFSVSIHESSDQMRQISAANSSLVDFFIKPKVALENGIVDLTSLITKDCWGHKVISIFVTGGGDGTLSVIRKMYDSPEIHEMFPRFGWVKLFHPFNLQDFLKRLGTQFILGRQGGNGLPATTEDRLVHRGFFKKLTNQSQSK